MKRILCALLTLLFLVPILGSCGAAPSETAAPPETVPVTAPDDTGPASAPEDTCPGPAPVTEPEFVGDRGELRTASVEVVGVAPDGFFGVCTDPPLGNVFVIGWGGNYVIGRTVTVRYYTSNLRSHEGSLEDGSFAWTHVIQSEPEEKSYYSPGGGAGKPMIYLYPETETACSVRLEFDGRLTCVYPDCGPEGWRNFIARPDGTLIFENGKEYYALFWEGEGGYPVDFSTGFCVKGSDTAAFLEEILPRLGLTPREAEEMIVFWLPKMQGNPYNLISFQNETYTDHARLFVTPEPDTLIRVMMAYRALKEPVEIEPPDIQTPIRRGFTLVEWGGTEC